MSPTLFLACIKSRVTLCVVLALCIVRAFELQSLYRITQDGLSIFQSYDFYNNIVFASFILVPLFGVLLIRPMRFLMGDNVAMRYPSRTSFACRQVWCALQQSLFYVAILNITTFPLVMVSFSLTTDFFLLVLLSALLQTLFFAVCALIFFTVTLSTRMAYVGYIALLVYGLWDYLMITIPGILPPFAGWGRTGISLPVLTTNVVVDCLFFAVLLCLLSLVMVAVSKRRDFLAKQEI